MRSPLVKPRSSKPWASWLTRASSSAKVSVRPAPASTTARASGRWRAWMLTCSAGVSTSTGVASRITTEEPYLRVTLDVPPPRRDSGTSCQCEVPVLEFHNLVAAPGRAVERHSVRRDADAVEQHGPNMWVGRRGHRLRSKDHGPPDATATAGSHMAQGRVPRSSQRRSRTRSWATASSQLERRGLLGNPCGGDDLGLHALEDLAWRAGDRRRQLSGGASQFLGRHNTTDEPERSSSPVGSASDGQRRRLPPIPRSTRSWRSSVRPFTRSPLNTAELNFGRLPRKIDRKRPSLQCRCLDLRFCSGHERWCSYHCA